MWHVSAERRGTTLIEVLVWSALFLFVLSVIYGSLVMGMDAYRRTENFATVQHQAMTALRDVSQDLANAQRAGVPTPSANAVVLASARDGSGKLNYDGTGKVLWQAWVTYYVTDQGWMRSRLAFTPSATLPTTIPTSSAIRSSGGASHQLVAAAIESLNVTLGTSTSDVDVVAANNLWGRTSVQVTDRVWFRQ